MSEDKTVYELAVNTWGESVQIGQFHEEVGELMQAINKYKRKSTQENLSNIFEEIADVEIMIGQLKVIFGDNGHVEIFHSEKFEKLKSKLFK